jgi:hypothetical protein
VVKNLDLRKTDLKKKKDGDGDGDGEINLPGLSEHAKNWWVPRERPASARHSLPKYSLFSETVYNPITVCANVRMRKCATNSR